MKTKNFTIEACINTCNLLHNEYLTHECYGWNKIKQFINKNSRSHVIRR